MGEGSASGEAGPVHGFFAGGLDFEEAEDAGGAGDETLMGIDECAGGGVGRFWLFVLDSEEFQVGVCEADCDAGPGVEGVDAAAAEFGGEGEVEEAVGFGELGGDGDEGFGLGDGVERVCGVLVEDGLDEGWAVVCEEVVELAGGGCGIDGGG